MSNYKDSFGQPKPPEQAIAARLTATAERLFGHEHYELRDAVDDVRFLLAHVETLTQQVAELRSAMAADDERLQVAEVRVFGDSTHGCDAADAMADVVISLRQENAQLRRAYLEARTGMCQAEQQRDAAHAALRRLDTERENHALAAQVTALTQLPADTNGVAPSRGDSERLLEEYRIDLAWTVERAEQAEQARDTAHAALKQYGQHDNGCGFYVKARCVCGLDAALAASAPQKEQ